MVSLFLIRLMSVFVVSELLFCFEGHYVYVVVVYVNLLRTFSIWYFHLPTKVMLVNLQKATFKGYCPERDENVRISQNFYLSCCQLHICSALISFILFFIQFQFHIVSLCHKSCHRYYHLFTQIYHR